MKSIVIGYKGDKLTYGGTYWPRVYVS
jgi:hypothetical protein